MCIGCRPSWLWPNAEVRGVVAKRLGPRLEPGRNPSATRHVAKLSQDSAPRSRLSHSLAKIVVAGIQRYPSFHSSIIEHRMLQAELRATSSESGNRARGLPVMGGALCQLSYLAMVGRDGFEPSTAWLSAKCENRTTLPAQGGARRM